MAMQLHTMFNTDDIHEEDGEIDVSFIVVRDLH